MFETQISIIRYLVESTALRGIDRWNEARGRDDAGYTIEQVALIALLVAAAIAVGTVLATKANTKANSINP
jgi:hypothetical protein